MKVFVEQPRPHRVLTGSEAGAGVEEGAGEGAGAGLGARARPSHFVCQVFVLLIT